MVIWRYLFQEHQLLLEIPLIKLEEVVEQVVMQRHRMGQMVEVFGLLILVFLLLME